MSPARVGALLAAFFASGAASLTFESLWFHQAGLAFGNDVWASSLVLAAFMTGLALGSLLAARLGDRPRSALRAYAVLECVVAFAGIGLVMSLPGIGRVVAPLEALARDAPVASRALRLVVAFALLLVPSTAMGATLPLLARALGGDGTRFGRTLGLLYGTNTAGAVAGVLGAELVLVDALGIRAAAAVAGALCVGAAALAALLGAGWDGGDVPPTTRSAAPATPVARLRWLACAFGAGFALLALEVVWLRFLVLFVNDTPVAFALVLAGVLAGIALGGLLASLWLGLRPRAHEHAGLVAYAAGLAGLAGYVAYPWVFQRAFDVDQAPSAVLLVALPLVLPTSLASGMLFTLLGSGLRSASASDAGTAGRLLFANTIGAALGPLVAGFVLLPLVGMELSLLGLFGLYGVLGLVLVLGSSLPPGLGYGASFAFVALLGFFPLGDMQSRYVRASAGRWMTAEDRIVDVRETSAATIVHIRHGLAGLRVFDQLATNAYSMSVDQFYARRYMKLFAWLPLALHPRVERALVIGYGVGNTAAALTASHDVGRIDVVDTSPEMLDASRAIPPRGAGHPLDDPRVHVTIEDGRHYLAVTRERFDLVTGEPPPPIMAGVANLYSREHFTLVRNRLTNGGIATYWLPMMNLTAASGRAIIRAFCAAFEDCSLWHGAQRNFMLMGSRGARGPVPADRFVRLWRDPNQIEELRATGFETPGSFGAAFIGDAAHLTALTRGDAPVTDDRPRRLRAPRNAADRAERDVMIAEWRDTAAARSRFGASALVAALWPAELVAPSLSYFENQRLINDLIFPGRSQARQVPVLDQVLRTPLRFPVLLLLDSDPDIEAALAKAPAAAHDDPRLRPHLLAMHLANRDFSEARAVLARIPGEQLALPGLRKYVEGLAASTEERTP